jgi:hypothetical protein
VYISVNNDGLSNPVKKKTEKKVYCILIEAALKLRQPSVSTRKGRKDMIESD